MALSWKNAPLQNLHRSAVSVPSSAPFGSLDVEPSRCPSGSLLRTRVSKAASTGSVPKTFKLTSRWLGESTRLTVFPLVSKVPFCWEGRLARPGKRRRLRTHCTGVGVEAFVEKNDEKEQVEKERAVEEDVGLPMIEHVKQIVAFSGPAIGIWLFNPVMSLVDTAVVGMGSSLELAALGPGTTLSDNLGYVFMFLSIATSNLIATAMANRDYKAAEDDLAKALFLAATFGTMNLVLVELFTTPLLAAFIGSTTSPLLPPSRTYVRIRGLAWPAVLVTMVAQSASLGMQDPLGPLQCLAVAAALNALGDYLLCCVFNYGIAGAAWATMASQVVGAVLMLCTLKRRGAVPVTIRIPSWKDVVLFMSIAGPTVVTTLSKVSFYTLMTYVCTGGGTATAGAHQVMLGLFTLFSMFSEPLSQTAQSFVPGYLTGAKRSLKKARGLLRSLMLIGVCQGAIIGLIAGSIPWVLPRLFTADVAIIAKMRTVSGQMFAALLFSHMNVVLEGTLLAGRDLVYLARSMFLALVNGGLLVVAGHASGKGLRWTWSCLLAFQSLRLVQSTYRMMSSKSVLGGILERKVATA